MPRSIQQIEQDMATLSENVAAIALELHARYSEYLQRLGQSVQQQLILASYHICTQVYPDAFLQLSFAERQKVQQDLQRASKQAQQSFSSLLDTSQQIPSPPLTEEQLNEEEAKQLNELLDIDTAPNGEPTEPIEEGKSEGSEAQVLSMETETLSTQLQQLNTPESALQWIKLIERSIGQHLQAAASEVNRIFQDAKILPMNLPQQFLEMAIQAEEAGSPMNNPPHLLSLLVESDATESENESKVVPITVIYLRLSEIEFSNPILNRERNPIRQLAANLSKLQKQYRKKQRERAIARAELAWRSSWYED
ncbi:hypothetical protein IQ249_05935 [Lusitaniella coriacea LEGE 07157]|uniref:Uncharacterized protein n=1 Tax=Lusitaniella coriacea LEGE 07157 TaxID=945747 RepID=A0A8J7AXJ8_9CYAN|nr:hypothetical protein [Lusitaniella coriacea]MBE9115437.1 hypothetical protein [Lusitaniella coriacea LEGE 07157]